MSKYNALWDYIAARGESAFKLTFDDIHQIVGIEIDHSFLNYKKELLAFGYQVGKISLKAQTVEFRKLES
ncbi:MAG: hypothetical protein CVV04_12550 [Firmicutes bacterium HGW-Firmicutes-9]|jgi:hypothetical protein|nr:MAG: hypothetical protein CVV04_12550 [Firmicutes bacterium HGW-Firmicutes-9]